jgi:hypothetical protein
MRLPSVAPLSFARVTERSSQLTQAVNEMYREGFTTIEIAKELDMSKSAVRYYYYGIHNCSQAHWHWKKAFDANKALGYKQYSLNQLRIGASVKI